MPPKCIENVDLKVCQMYTKDAMMNISTVFARAFHSYSLFQHTLPDSQKRTQQLDTLHQVLTCYASNHGKIYTTAKNESVLLTTIQEGGEVHNLGMIRCGAIKIPFQLGYSFLKKSDPYDQVMEAMHQQIMPQKHFYMWAIATEPSEQGKGHARRLATKAISDAKKLHLPIYCETSNPHNVEIYQKMGMTVKGSRKIGNITIWGMTLEN